MASKGIDKRIAALERRALSSAPAVLLQKAGEALGDALSRWEGRNGPLGDRYALVVRFIAPTDVKEASA